MFELIDETTPLSVEIFIDGKPHLVPENISVAAAVLLCGLTKVRKTPVSGSGRAPLCMMGVCFDCLMVIDGVANRRGCQVIVQPGMSIERQLGAVALEGSGEAEL